MAKVLVGIPIRQVDGMPSPRTQACLEQLKSHTQHAVEIYLSRGQQITQNSLNICLKVLQEGWDYLLYTGDDITFSPQALNRLISLDVDVAGGLCVWKSPPYWTTGAIETDDGKLKLLLITREHVVNRAVIEVDAVGSGFMLIKRKALEAVDNYFRLRAFPKIPDEFKWMSPVPYFPVAYDSGNNCITGSDFAFCKAAKRAGCKIVLDCGVVCGHSYNYEYTIEDHWRWIERHGFLSELPPFPGADMGITQPPLDMIFWGDSGGPMDITVTSATAQHRAEDDVFPILKAIYGPVKDLEFAGKTKAGCIVGFGITDDVKPTDYLDWSKRFSKTVIHWTKKDVQAISSWITPEYKNALTNGSIVHFTEDKETDDLFRDLLGESKIVSLPTSRTFPVVPLPKNFTVGVLWEDGPQGEILKSIIAMNSDIKFKMFCMGEARPFFDYANMIYVYKPSDRVYGEELSRCSAMLLIGGDSLLMKRFAKEAMMAGRDVICDFDLPYAEIVDTSNMVVSVNKALAKLALRSEIDMDMVKQTRLGNDFRAFRERVAEAVGISPMVMENRRVYGNEA